MNTATIACIMAASISLTGCGKNPGTPGNASAPPAQSGTSSPVTQGGASPPVATVPPTDDELRQKAGGVWKHSSTTLGFTTDETFTLAANGNYAMQTIATGSGKRQTNVYTGSWYIKNGMLYRITAKMDRMPAGAYARGLAEQIAGGVLNKTNRIVSIGASEIVIEADAVRISSAGQVSHEHGTSSWTRANN